MSRRAKKDIKHVEYANIIDAFISIPIVNYHYLNETENNRVRTGIIYEDLLDIPYYRECVVDDIIEGRRTYGIDIDKLNMLNMIVLQELCKKIK